MASTYLLLADLRDQLVAHFKDMPFREPVRGGQPLPEQYHTPRVYIGDLPTKRKSGVDPETLADRGEDFPYILIRPLDGDSPSDNPSIQLENIGILCGIYNADGNSESGTHDILNMMDAVKSLLSRTLYVAGMRWRRRGPITWNSGVDRKLDLYAAGSHGGGPFFGGGVFAQFEGNAAVFEDFNVRKHIVDQGEPAHPAF